MYYPYLRGKQFELLALRELAGQLDLAATVRPIVEPVRLATGSGLRRFTDQMRSKDITQGIVINPSVGDLASPDGSATILQFLADTDPAQTYPAVLVRRREQVERDLALLASASLPHDRIIAVIDGSLPTELYGAAGELLAQFPGRVDVVPPEARGRHLSRLGSQESVILSDPFPNEPRNADYIGKAPQFFSDDYVYYRQDGYAGFGDYQTIGRDWTDGGFSPRVVAIHWTYVDEEGGPIMIRHFTSTTNYDTSDVGGKFLEAARSLKAFLDERQIDTLAADSIRAHVEAETYPGLGVVKKYSIQNHIQLVSSLIA